MRAASSWPSLGGGPAAEPPPPLVLVLVLVLVLLLLSGALSFCPRFRGLVTSVPKCAAFHFSCFLFSQVSLSRAAFCFSVLFPE
jgi:hypothetical protein